MAIKYDKTQNANAANLIKINYYEIRTLILANPLFNRSSGFFLWCNILLALNINLEDSKLNPEENNSIESSPNLNEDNKDLNEGIKKEENVKAFTEFLEKASSQDSSEEKVKLDSAQQKPKIDKSLFKRFLNNGFDGISTNPNYKMLALLIILLINLSLFFVIGNMGKAFLRNAGIMV